jgi:hypothetical protein
LLVEALSDGVKRLLDLLEGLEVALVGEETFAYMGSVGEDGADEFLFELVEPQVVFGGELEDFGMGRKFLLDMDEG